MPNRKPIIDEEIVLYETQGHVAIITLNRPKARNAVSKAMREKITKAQKAAENDKNIRIVILTAAGTAFSAGTDLSEGYTAEDGTHFDYSVTDYKPLIDAISISKKTYIAAINGIVGGVSLSLVMACDLAIMSEDASMFSPFANIGLVPDGGTSWYLLQHLDYKRAYAAIIECGQISAQTCLDTGMVNKVVPASDLRDAAIAWGQRLSACSPLALQYSKEILRAASSMTRQQVALLESEYQNKCSNSEDSKNAIAAFFKKQTPVFKG